MENKQLINYFTFYQAIVDIAKIFGETELGSDCEVNEAAVAQYCLSSKYIVDNWGITTKEEVYDKITNDILDGMRIWDFLKISDWTKEMLDRDFLADQAAQMEKLRKTYKCYTCKWFEMHDTSIGLYTECNRPRDKRSWSTHRRGDFKIKKQCKNYEVNK